MKAKGMKIDLSKYRLGPQQKSECRCGAKVYFLISLTSDVSLFFLCTECGEIARPVPGGRTIISEGEK